MPTDDRTPIPPPRHIEANRVLGEFLGHVSSDAPARGVTPLDEVPDSTWFTNRNAVRPLSPAAIRRGPAEHPAARDGYKWFVIGVKQTGMALGVRARDEAGDEFFLKLDPEGHDEVETGADVVVQRLLFAAGYNVPENDIVYVRRADLAIAPDATARASDLNEILARAARERDGRYRILASRVVPGKPLGGIRGVGTRFDDANDHIPHEDRRDMRGLYSLAAWLNHTDIKPANTHEAWVPEPGDPSRGHVVHYLLDFGKALGAMARIDYRPETGYVHHNEDASAKIEHAITGTPVPWADLGPFPTLRGMGWFESEHFDPLTWTPLHPWLPFEKADRFDRFWGARIVASFTPEQIRAALAAARYTEPRTVKQLARVLEERQRKVLEATFREVAPLDHFELRAGRLCFVDLWKRHALGGEATYMVLGERASAKDDGTVCVDLPREVPSTIEIRVERPGQKLPPTRVHLTTGDAPCVQSIERL